MIACRDATIITEPGLYTMPAPLYHADPWPQPSLSASLIQVMLKDSPLHAWARHPKLNPAAAAEVSDLDESSKRMDVGSVIHKLALDEGDEIVVLPFKDYRTRAAKEARREALVANKLPCLPHQYEHAAVVSKPFKEAVSDLVGIPVADCLREKVIAWEFNGVRKRSRADLMTPDLSVVVDLKSTALSVAPDAVEKRIYDGMYHIQAQHYLDGLDAIDPAGVGRRRFIFLFVEQGSPYAVSAPTEVDEAGLTLAAEQIALATDEWSECLDLNEWPSYPNQLCYAAPPPWLLSRHMARMTQLAHGESLPRRATRDHIADLNFLYGKRRELAQESSTDE